MTTLLSHKINRKMTMSHKLVWMDEKFVEVAFLFNYHFNLVQHIVFCNLSFM
jgi:hypothetical protein